ncbi:Lrp/AsnC family transcriptional regulator, partial [Escherichia coli]|uniref:Lrp/AsnC family transcriptional regulator n=1 Tax=Escherichia coli TaxID=562 RepID=UPI00197CBD09
MSDDDEILCHAREAISAILPSQTQKFLAQSPAMASQKSLELDAFDIAILNAVQRCYTTPLRVIGEEVNLSTAAVQRRIKRMEEAGVIVGNVAVVDPERVG